MTKNSLETWIEDVRADWGPLDTALVAKCGAHLARLIRAPASEDWLAALHREAPARRELYRDPDHGFMLLAHTEQAGVYRSPHDHGRSWVIYAVQQGEVEMGSYGRIEGAAGRPRLVRRDSNLVRAGDVRAYLPGDIHDTLCVSGSALQFRFTERDLRREDEEHHLTRYVERNGVWTTGA